MEGTHRHGLTLRFTTSNALSAGTVVYANFRLQELIEKCHPLGMFDSIVTLPVATNMPWVNVDGKTSCHQNSKDWLTADFPPPQWSLQTCTCGHSTRIVFWWLYDNKLGRVEHRIIAKYCLQGRNFKHKLLWFEVKEHFVKLRWVRPTWVIFFTFVNPLEGPPHASWR